MSLKSIPGQQPPGYHLPTLGRHRLAARRLSFSILDSPRLLLGTRVMATFMVVNLAVYHQRQLHGGNKTIRVEINSPL
jgi:hypothetical protein